MMAKSTAQGMDSYGAELIHPQGPWMSENKKYCADGRWDRETDQKVSERGEFRALCSFLLQATQDKHAVK